MKFLITYIPTERSRKLQQLFICRKTNAEAIQAGKEEFKRRFPEGCLISVQGPDHFFLDLEEQFTFYFLDHPGSRHIRQHSIIADSRTLAEEICRRLIGHRWPNYVMLPTEDLAEAANFMRSAV